MQIRNMQMSMFDTYNDVAFSLENNKPKFFALMEKYICWDELIPVSFYHAFYKDTGRKRVYTLESLIAALVLQRVFGYTDDVQLLNTLKYSREMREFCGFTKVPDADKITRFKQNFCVHLEELFEKLVDMTEPICRQINAELSDCLIFDTTGVESYVAENNPKYMNSKLRQAKSLAKSSPSFNPYTGVYSLLPDCAQSNPGIKQQYINGHYCYAQKAAVVTNGLGIVRHISFLDEGFRRKHSETSFTKRSDNPDVDKEIGDSVLLKPVLKDFFNSHRDFRYSTFIGDAAFDKYDHYTMLLKDFKFKRALIPLNHRNTKNTNIGFDENGTPLCPADNMPMIFLGKSGGKNRSERYKWVCPKSEKTGTTRICTCETPCTGSKYGRCVYTYPDKDLRLYPGIARGTQEWDSLYSERTVIERTIYSLKSSFCVDNRKTSNSLTTKSDLILAGITQLIGVLLAKAINDVKLLRRVRKLIA